MQRETHIDAHVPRLDWPTALYSALPYEDQHLRRTASRRGVPGRRTPKFCVFVLRPERLHGARRRAKNRHELEGTWSRA